eukprot:59561-Chlamydomonas_euryale.AAC.4
MQGLPSLPISACPQIVALGGVRVNARVPRRAHASHTRCPRAAHAIRPPPRPSQERVALFKSDYTKQAQLLTANGNGRSTAS